MAEKKNRSGKWGRSVLVLMAAGGLGLLLLLARDPAIEVATGVVDRGRVLEWVRSEGVFRARVHETLMAPADGDISRIVLDAGDPVRAGQKVASLYWDQGFSVVRSPLRGVISVVHREVAGPVRRGEPLLTIVDPSQLELRVELLTRDALRIRPGARAEASDIIGGLRGAVEPEVFARVVRVSRAGFIKPSALGVEEERTHVVLEPESTPRSRELLERVGDHFHAEVAIEISRRDDVLRVPLGALVRAEGPGGGGSAERWQVYQVKQGRARLQDVRLALLGEEHAEVLGGLDAGDTVVMYPGEDLREGVRVQ
jgi:HlyD family secretion protein